MHLSTRDKSVVYNIRHKHGKTVEAYTDEHIAKTWREFSQSDEYPDEDKFLEWLSVDHA